MRDHYIIHFLVVLAQLISFFFKKYLVLCDDQSIFRAMIRSHRQSQTLFSEELKTPRTDLTGTWPYLPAGLGKGVVMKSERYTRFWVVVVPSKDII